MEVRINDLIALFITAVWGAVWVVAALNPHLPQIAQIWEKGNGIMAFVLGYYFKSAASLVLGRKNKCA